MIKILSIGVLLYLFYRLVDNSGKLKGPDPRNEIDNKDDEFIEYEEVE